MAEGRAQFIPLFFPKLGCFSGNQWKRHKMTATVVLCLRRFRWPCFVPRGRYLSHPNLQCNHCSRSSCQEEMLTSSGFITTPRTQAAAQTLFSVSLAGNDLFKTDILRVHYTSCLDAMQLVLESAAFHTDIY